MEDWEESEWTFYDELEDLIDNKESNKFVITDELYDQIIEGIKSDQVDWSTNEMLREWSKATFRLKSDGTNDYLETIGGKKIPKMSELFGVIRSIHEEVGHRGKDPTFFKLFKQYGFVKRDVVELFVRCCPVCQQQATARTVSQILASSVIQFSVIDVTEKGDPEYNYILHTRDPITRFSWGDALRTRSAEEVASCLRNIFSSYGPPMIIHSHESEEFLTEVVTEIARSWPDLKMPKCQHDLPEIFAEVNADLIHRLESWMSRHNGESWTEGMNISIYRMNWTISPTHGLPPFELLYPWRRREIPLESPTRAVRNEVPEVLLDSDESQSENDSSDASEDYLIIPVCL